jgi:hypothetical protein
MFGTPRFCELGRGRRPFTVSPDDVAGFVVVDSASLMAETEQPLVQAIEAAGLKVAARIDHGANAKKLDQACLQLSCCFSATQDWYTLDPTTAYDGYRAPPLI